MPRILSYPILLSTLVFLSAMTARAQSSRPAPSPPAPPITSSDKPEHPDFGADPSEDLRARLAIKADQKHHEETLERAREASELGSQLLDAYKTTKSIGGEEYKKSNQIKNIPLEILKKVAHSSVGSCCPCKEGGSPRRHPRPRLEKRYSAASRIGPSRPRPP